MSIWFCYEVKSCQFLQNPIKSAKFHHYCLFRMFRWSKKATLDAPLCQNIKILSTNANVLWQCYVTWGKLSFWGNLRFFCNNLTDIADIDRLSWKLGNVADFFCLFGYKLMHWEKLNKKEDFLKTMPVRNFYSTLVMPKWNPFLWVAKFKEMVQISGQ